MTNRITKAIIIYCSPAGTTRHVAQVIEDQIKASGSDVTILDLGERGDATSAISQIRESGEDTCLFIGSPVYVSHAIPPVMNFISNLPENASGFAVPFVTWGGACSGIALYEMGKALSEKGFRLMGAAKVLALHSLLWRTESPLGKGHPDNKDDEMIRELVAGVTKKIAEDPAKELPISELAYYPEDVRAEMEKISLAAAKAFMPKRKVAEDACTQCNICSDVCPTCAVTLSPYPQFGDQCIFCLNCVRECPEDAIKVDLSQLEARIKDRSEQFKERPFTKIFV